MIRSTHTFAVADVSTTTYNEVRKAFVDAGYDHAFLMEDDREVIDMHGVALRAITDGDHAMQPPSAGTIEVGIDPLTNEVVINHPNIQPDKDGAGYIVFSPDQARGLATVLLKKSSECEDAIAKKS